jgi:hypothetical protein
MRDAHRLKERYEVSLDSRQIFFLFFGGAVAACLVFVVGVMVGKRLEARQARKARPATDELSLIDRDTEATEAKLTFHDELIKPDARFVKDVPPEVLDWRHMDRSQPPKANVVAMNDGDAPDARARPGSRRAARRSPDGRRRSRRAGRRSRRAGPQGRGRGERGEGHGAGGRQVERKRSGMGNGQGKAKGKRKRFTLQAGAYKSRAEARQMLEKLRSEGYRPYVVAANIPQKGVWYRVRLGSFASWKQALNAKQRFEQKANTTAYVSRR